MRLEEFCDILKTTGLPVAYRAFPEEEAPKLPYICYQNPENNNFAADGIVFFLAREIQVELYTKNKEDDLSES